MSAATPLPDGVAVRLADWEIESHLLLAVRRAVFVVEQGVPEALEVDGKDPACVHLLAWDPDIGPVGTARLHSASGKVGRVAVLRAFRRRGIGAGLISALVGMARESGLPRLVLHAQVDSLPFYECLGFRTEGPVFDEAGIPHRRMILLLE